MREKAESDRGTTNDARHTPSFALLKLRLADYSRTVGARKGDKEQEMDVDHEGDSEMVVDAHEIENMADENEGDDENFNEGVPSFPALSTFDASGRVIEKRRVPVPPNRLTPLKQHWMAIYQPLVEHMKLQVRFNPKRRCVDLRVRLFIDLLCVCVCVCVAKCRETTKQTSIPSFIF